MKEIVKQAIKLGICKPWAKMMLSADIKQLCNMFFDGSDWAIQNNFPSLEMLRNHADESMQYGLITDKKGLAIKNGWEVAFFGDSNAILEYDGFNVGDVYLRNNSVITANVFDNSVVTFTVLDDSELHVKTKGEARVYVYKYGGKVKHEGNVKIIDSTFDK